ncbi:hypothetical protein PoB_005505600 [Plakobranchus ocellatus]|uniref:Uncharacterized protein n=1 Tax=Plakobranchus ocellatus TaxID=259542 RepID=A0AAV4C770_9GAST|nr:hypothetical protein PoB_005505600 [Plakobranchus ocellatus]
MQYVTISCCELSLDLDLFHSAGANHYCINENGKEKTFHSNVLKKYIIRDAASDESQTEDGPMSAASLAIVEDNEAVNNDCDNYGCEISQELGGWGKVARRQ